jgi:hypothetical protein
MKTKNDVNLGAGKKVKNEGTWGQADSTGMPPKQKVIKAEDLTYLSISFDPR